MALSAKVDMNSPLGLRVSTLVGPTATCKTIIAATPPKDERDYFNTSVKKFRRALGKTLFGVTRTRRCLPKRPVPHRGTAIEHLVIGTCYEPLWPPWHTNLNPPAAKRLCRGRCARR